MLVASQVAPGSAMARLPDPPNKVILTGRSIAGVALGAHWKKARATWGKRGADCRKGWNRELLGNDCVYSGKGRQPAYAFFGTGRRKVRISSVGYGVGRDRRGRPKFDTPLRRWRTRRGIHLGSSAKDVQRAHPGAKRDPSESDAEVVRFTVQGKGQRRTTFTTMRARAGTRLRVIAIDMVDNKLYY